MTLGAVQRREFLAQMGEMLAEWNELEQHLFDLLVILSGSILAGTILAANLQTDSLLKTLKLVASEYDALRQRIDKTLRHKAKQKKLIVKMHGRAVPRVHHLSDYVDRLREYRNYYVHGLRVENKGFYVFTRSARSRLAAHYESLSVGKIKWLRRRIKIANGYARKIYRSTLDNENPLLSKPPSWPRKPPLPDKIQKPRLNLLDELPQPLSLPG